MMRSFLAGHWPALILSLLLALLASALGLVVPWLIKTVVDEALLPGRGELILPLAAAILATGVLRFAAAFARRGVSAAVSLRVEMQVRDRLFAHLQRLGFDYYTRQQTGQLVSRALSDVRAVRAFLSYGLIFTVTHGVTLVAVTVILLVLQPTLALACLLPLPLMLVVARIFSSRLHPSLYAIQQRVAELTAVAEERIMGIRVIKALGIEELEQEAFARASDRIYRQHLDAAAIRSRFVPLLGLLPTISLIVILFYGGRLVIADRLTLGSFLAFNAYVMLLVWPLRMLGMLVSWAGRATAAGERVFEVLDQEPSVRDRPGVRPAGRLRGEIEMRDVSFAYEIRRVLDRVNLRISAGETIALVGPTGCGKTTLAHLVPRFYDPSAGAVLLDGHDLRDLEQASVRRQIGLVEQDPFLFSLTVRDNIRYGDPAASEERVRAAARAAAAEDFVRELPFGYDTLVGERGVILSGGQRQRLALARALLIDPRILILDDATSSIDAETETRIMAALRTLHGTRTVIIIAHRPSTVTLADRVALMEAGRIVCLGPPGEVPWEQILIREAETSAHGARP